MDRPLFGRSRADLVASVAAYRNVLEEVRVEIENALSGPHGFRRDHPVAPLLERIHRRIETILREE